jgi:hypothetical protein
LVGLAIAPILGEVYGTGHSSHKDEAPKKEEVKPTSQIINPEKDATTYNLK